MSVKVVDGLATSLRLREMLEERGLKPKDVQQALHLESIQAVYKWLNPNIKSLPSIDNLVALAYLMDCALEDILVLREVDL